MDAQFENYVPILWAMLYVGNRNVFLLCYPQILSLLKLMM